MEKPMSESPEEQAGEATPVEESAPAPEAVKQVDLVAEASQAAATVQQSEGTRIRSLDDLDLDGAVRSQIESYVSKSVNEAIGKHDERRQEQFDKEGFMNRAQIEDLLQEKDAEFGRREEAKDNFLSTLGSEGIAPGSEEYTEVQSFYQSAVQDGRLTPHILLSEAGIRTLIAMSGVNGATEMVGPKSGLDRSAPAPDGSVVWADGTTQLNARNSGDPETLDDRLRRDIARSLDQ
jgi:hypothetical protein